MTINELSPSQLDIWNELTAAYARMHDGGGQERDMGFYLGLRKAFSIATMRNEGHIGVEVATWYVDNS